MVRRLHVQLTGGFARNSIVNNTFVYSPSEDLRALCFDDTIARCSTVRGGLFDTDQSDTFQEDQAGRPDLNQNGALTFGIDTVTVRENISMPDFPVDVRHVSHHYMNTLGVGAESTVLTRLRDWGYIASRSFSYWHGFNGAGAEDQVDGHMILGGYDRARTRGQNVTAPISNNPDCPGGLVVSVENVQMKFASGRSVGLMGESVGRPLESFCVNSGVPEVVFPEPVLNRFINATGGESTKAFYGFAFPNDDV